MFNLKLAAYLDEAGDDPASAARLLASLQVNYIVLRQVWGTPILDANDQACSRLRQILDENKLSAVAIISDLGAVDTSLLGKIPRERTDRLFNLAAFFKSSMLRVHCGTREKGTADEKAVTAWMGEITDRCLASSTVPLYEIGDQSPYREPADVARVLTAFRRWKLLYDPTQLIIRQNQNPFSRYWTLLKGQTAAVDVRDFKIGHGFKPAGFGDAKMRLTIEDGVKGVYKNWYFLESSLGRRYGQAVTREETFKLAYEALENIVS